MKKKKIMVGQTFEPKPFINAEKLKEKLLVIGNFRRVIKLRYRKNYKSFSRNLFLYQISNLTNCVFKLASFTTLECIIQ